LFNYIIIQKGIYEKYNKINHIIANPDIHFFKSRQRTGDNMRKKLPLIITGVLIVAIFIVLLLKNTTAADNYKDSYYYQKYAQMDEDQIYEELISHDADYIIEEVKNIENDVGKQSIEIYIPFAQALIDKEKDLEVNEILDLIQDQDTKEIVEHILIQMYIDKAGDTELLNRLLNSNISDHSKNDIVAKSEFTLDELRTLFEFRQDSFIHALVIRMNSAMDEEEFYEKGMKLLFQPRSHQEQFAIHWFTPDLYRYAEKTGDTETCSRIIDRVFQLYNEETEDWKIQYLVTLGDMGNAEVLREMLNDESYDEMEKISFIVNASAHYIDWLEQDSISEDKLQLIIDSMYILPGNEVKSALQAAVERGTVENTQSVSDVIQYIEENGADLCLEGC
jgi:hypothetical protein